MDTVAILPPEYFPRLPYMALVQHVDRCVLADTFAYRGQSFQNRARLRNPQGWQWITIPLRAHQKRNPIRSVRINEEDPWIGKHWRALQYNYRSTPYFEYFEPQVEPYFHREWTHLGALTCASVELLHDLMGLSTELVRASTLDGAPNNVPRMLGAMDMEAATLVALPEHVGAATEGAEQVRAFHFEAPEYHQNFDGFEPGMSTVDLLFNYGPDTRSMLADHAAVEPVQTAG